MDVDISIVSHGQAHLAQQLIEDLVRGPAPSSVRLTHNISDNLPELPTFPGLISHVNNDPLGFAANHNAAFKHSRQPFFAVVNPDIRLTSDPFPALLRCMDDPEVGLVAPVVLNPLGSVEDSVRRYPTPAQLLSKSIGKDDGRYHLTPDPLGLAQPVEWVAGMFMLFRAEAFRDLGGFDEKFHLYYEDVDICARLWQAGWKVVVSPQATVVHDAQRASRHNLKYMAWHAASMTRYFYKHYGRLPEVPSSAGKPVTVKTLADR
jgi:N-acetylglucosaminyl-diphospho-decaprenol L-rhamnosyltransferase